MSLPSGLIEGIELLAEALCPIVSLAALIGIPLLIVYLRPDRNGEHAARLRRLAQVRTRRCIGCGYDIHASEFRCPECGRVIVSEAAVMGWIPPDAQTAADALACVEDDSDSQEKD